MKYWETCREFRVFADNQTDYFRLLKIPGAKSKRILMRYIQGIEFPAGWIVVIPEDSIPTAEEMFQLDKIPYLDSPDFTIQRGL